MTIGDTLYIVIPAYNEEANLEELLRAWDPMLDLAGPESRILIIDDGSKDGTGALLDRLSGEYPRLRVRHENNKGHGPTLYQAYRLALEAGADYIFQCDSDNQCGPEFFPELWLRRGAHAQCSGLRRARRDGRGRRFVSRVLSLVIWLSFGTWVRDANVPYRLYRRSVLEALLPCVEAAQMLTNAALFACAGKLRLSHYRCDIPFAPRRGGVNSLNWRRIFGIGARSLRGLCASARQLKRRRVTAAQCMG